MLLLRPATLLDHPTTATFSVPAFLNDELYQFTNPSASQYPQDFRQHYLRRHRLRSVLPAFVFWVAVEDASGDVDKHATGQDASQSDHSQWGHGSVEKVVGYAIWRRYGDSEQARRWQTQTWAECRGPGLRAHTMSLSI